MIKKETLIFLFILSMLALLYDVRLTFNQGIVITNDGFTSDLMNDRYPVRVELGRALQQGTLSLWTPLIYTGFPLQANPESGITYPINILLFKLFSPALALNLSILLKFFLAAAFLFLYLRTIGINPRASLFGAIAFSWCGFFIAHLKHLNMHDAGIWIPLMLTFLERHHTDRKIFWIILTSLVLGLQFLAGHPQISYYTILLLTAYFLWHELPSHKDTKGIIRILGYAAFFVLLGVGLGMLQILPTMELTNFSERGGGVSYQFATQYSYYLPDLLTFLYPYINGDPGNATYTAHGIFWEDYGYVGLLTLFFALYAIVMTFRKNRHTRFFTLAFAIAFILMLGDQAILFKILFKILPGMNYFRFATRFVLFVDLFLAVLAGIGLAEALKNKKQWIYILIIAFTIGDLYYMQKRQNPVVSKEKWEEPPYTAEILKRDPGLFRIFSIGAVEWYRLAYEQASGWESDLKPYIQQREILQPSSNMLYGISSADGYINLTPKYLIKMWGNEKQMGLVTQTGHLSPDGQKLIVTNAFVNITKAFNVKYLLSIWPLENPDLEMIGKPSGIYLFLNKKVLPRAFLVPSAVHLDDDTASQALVAGQIDLQEKVIIADSNTLSSTEDYSGLDMGQVYITSYSAERIELEANIMHDCWLVLSDSYYPGWRVIIDDQETKIYRANLCSRTIPMKEGSHKIVFFFQPQSFQHGGVISIVSLIIAFLVIVIDTRRKKGGKG